MKRWTLATAAVALCAAGARASHSGFDVATPSGETVRIDYYDAANLLKVTVLDADGHVEPAFGRQISSVDDPKTLLGTTAAGDQWGVQVEDDASPRDDDFAWYCVGANDTRPYLDPAALYVQGPPIGGGYFIQGRAAPCFSVRVRQTAPLISGMIAAVGAADYTVTNVAGTVSYGVVAPVSSSPGPIAPVPGLPGVFECTILLTFDPIEGASPEQQLHASAHIETPAGSAGGVLGFEGDVTCDHVSGEAD